MTFQYYTGQIVLPGDRVFTCTEHAGIVVLVIQPRSEEAEWYQTPDGGILIEEDWNGTPSLLLMRPPDGRYWEELELIARAPENTVRYE